MADRDDFWRDGFLILRNVFGIHEMACIKQAIRDNQQMQDHLAKATEKKAFETLSVWNDTSDYDIFSLATRSNRIMYPLKEFFEDDIYVYHNKVTLKGPGVVGFPYHQDYAYWYDMGNLFPDMATVYIALEPATKENGCLKLVRGSHKLGRVLHRGHDGVDPERLEVILSRFGPDAEVYAELELGDVVMFHCNTFHGSDDNKSSNSRLSLLGCYNTKHNDSYIRACGHPFYIQQEWVYEKITEADCCKFPKY